MINKEKYSDVMIVDSQGIIIYGDFANPRYFGMESNTITQNNIRYLYKNIDDTYPALVAAREGIVSEHFEIKVKTAGGNTVTKVGAAYPIFDEDIPIAAIEFSDLHYDKEHIRELESHADFPIYRKNNTKYKIEDIITGDTTMIGIKKQIEHFAITDSSVLIYGETGTGKELVAQSLHNCSRRYYRKFISVNCGAIPRNIMEGLIFGTTKGSFTGAEDKPGLFEQADGGTIFLDEINSLEPMLQIKLFKAVESKIIRRVGSLKEKEVDVRIIAATNEEPHELIRSGRLKSDLFYRLAVIYMYIPPLRDRGNDVNLITDHFVNYFNQKIDMNIAPVGDEIRDIFKKYTWPGNVRELRNAIEGAFAFAENDRIEVKDLPQNIVKKSMQTGSKHHVESLKNAKTLSEMSDALEYAVVSEAYSKSGSSLTKAAEAIGISKQLLKYKLSKYER